MARTWEIWCEGSPHKSGKEMEQAWRVPLETNTARWPPAVGETFQEACDNVFLGREPHYNSVELTLGGFKLYENEALAQRRFG